MANIQKELNAIKNAVYGREVRGSIHDGIYKVNRESEGSRQIANDTKQRQDAVEQQFNTLLSEWSDDKPIDNAETIAARTNTKESKTYENLGKRLDEEYEKVTTQLEKIEEEMFKSSLVLHKRTRPMFVWHDDDGHKGVYTKLAPLLREYGIVMSVAVITNRPHGFPIEGLPDYDPDDNYMSYEQMKELENEGLVEFICHSHTHDINYDLTQMTVEEMHEELSTCQNIIRQLGWNYRDFVYPFGRENPTVHNVVRQYFRSAFDAGGGAVLTPFNQFKIPRIKVDAPATFEEIKEDIDKAFENNTLGVLTTHVDQYGGLDLQKMRQVIEYILSRGGEFVTTAEAINEFGNLLQLDENNIISYDGEIHGRSIGVYRNGHLDYPPNAPITDFKRGTVTRIKVRRFELEEYGLSPYIGRGYGYIETHRDTTEDVFSFQRYVDVESKRILIRNWNTEENKWDAWEDVTGTVVYPPNSKTAEDPPTSFRSRAVSLVHLSDGTPGLPTSSGGVLKTYRLTDNDSSTYQEFKNMYNYRYYTRNWEGSSWGIWRPLNSHIVQPRDFYSSSTPAQNFPPQAETITFIRNEMAAGFPENKGGVLKTFRIATDTSMVYQEYKIHDSNNVYMRTWTASGWGDWELK